MDSWLLQYSILVIYSTCHVMSNGRTQTSVHSNCVHRTTKVSAVLLCNFSNSPKFLKSNNTVTEAKCRLLFYIYLYIYRYRCIEIYIISWVTKDVCRTSVKVLPNGIVMDSSCCGHKDVPDGVGKGDHSVTLEEHHAQAIDQTSPGHLLQSFGVAHGCHYQSRRKSHR